MQMSKTCNINFWTENDPPPPPFKFFPLKFIRLGTVTRPTAVTRKSQMGDWGQMRWKIRMFSNTFFSKKRKTENAVLSPTKHFQYQMLFRILSMIPLQFNCFLLRQQYYVLRGPEWHDINKWTQRWPNWLLCFKPGWNWHLAQERAESSPAGESVLTRPAQCRSIHLNKQGPWTKISIFHFIAAQAQPRRA